MKETVTQLKNNPKFLSHFPTERDAFHAIDAVLDCLKPQIRIQARRWFQKTCGNTYHSVIVYVDGQEVGRVDYTYGYGEQYLQTAFEILSKKTNLYPQIGEHPNGSSFAFSAFYEDKINERERFHISVDDVPRKRDL